LDDAMTKTVASSVCPACQAPVTPEERYCESCGADLTVTQPLWDSGSGDEHDEILLALGGRSEAFPGESDDSSFGADRTADRPRRQVLGSGVVLDVVDVSGTLLVCPECSSSISPDGYCEQCGAAAPRIRDHWVEAPVGWVAGVSDRGLRHPSNEDAMAVAALGADGGFAALVVCDGVSSSSGSAEASLAAARAARQVLALGATASGPPEDRPELDPPSLGMFLSPASGPGGGMDPVVTPASGERADVLTRWMAEATYAAQLEVVACAGDPPRENPPSCTFVAAVVDDGLIVVGWVGDSRVYWVPDEGRAEQLTTDDSWAAEQIAMGVPRDVAETSPQAHAITRWLGVDAPYPVPRVTIRKPGVAGWVVTCSDGLWNYCSAPDDLARVFSGTVAEVGDDPTAVSEALVRWAIRQGGHDNISVSLARINETQG
jgi:serine/threonine protein phosphatase PrpC